MPLLSPVGSVWILCLLVGGVLLCFRTLRWRGFYLIGISLGAMLVQFLVLIAMVLLSERIVQWGGLNMIGPVLAALGVSQLIGAFAGFLLTRKLLRRGSPGGQHLKPGDE